LLDLPRRDAPWFAALPLAGLHRRWRLRHAERRISLAVDVANAFLAYNSPTPHSIFFDYGFAIHGTTDIARLGGPASHGCVRLHPSNARRCMGWSSARAGSTRIEIN
jgi:lipoprotein-anchoring transpeptidase ErfK/SrfK